MIAVILIPLSCPVALYFAWSCGKCLSTAPRGTTGRSSQKNQAPELLPSPIPMRHEGTSAHAAIHGPFHFLEGWFDMRDLGAAIDREEPRCQKTALSS